MVRRKISRPVGILTAALLIATSGPLNANANEPAEVPVQFADKELQACVQEVVPSLLPSKVAELTELSCEYDGEQPHMIHDFYGFEMLTNVEKVTLTNFNVVHPAEDAEPEVKVAAMLPIWEKLETLTIDKSEQLPMWISELPELKDLNLTNGKFSELPEFFELPKLERIDLTGSNIPASAVFTEDPVEIIGAAAEPESEDETAEAESEDAEEEAVEEEAFEEEQAKAEAEAQERSSLSAHEEPQAVTRGGEPADDELLPDGQIKQMLYPDTDITYAETKQLTKIDLDARTELAPGETGLPTFNDFTGVNFFPNVTEVTFSGGRKNAIEFPSGMSLGDLFPNVETVRLFSTIGDTMPNLDSDTVTFLDVRFNKATEFRKFNMPALKELWIMQSDQAWQSGVVLTEFDLTGMTSLETIDVSKAMLKSTAGLKSPTATKLIINGDWGGDQDLTTLDLSGLPNILEVEAENQKALDPSAIHSESLQKLSIGGSWSVIDKISEEAASNMPNLQELSFAKSPQSSFQISHPGLKVLDLTQCRQMRTLPSLGNLPSLETILAPNSSVSSINGLASGSLVTLDLTKTKVNEIPEDLNLPSLKELILNRATPKISSVSLSGLPAIERLELERQAVSDFSQFASPTLKVLYIPWNRIKEISESTALPALEELYADVNGVQSLSFAGMPKIKVAEFSSTSIGSLEYAKSDSLTNLKLASSKIESLDGLEGIPNLEILNLDGNKITNIKKLSEMTHIKASLKRQTYDFGLAKVGEANSLEGYYELPEGYAMDWTQENINDSVAVSPLKNQFVVLKPGSFGFSGKLIIENQLEYGLTIFGEAEDGGETISVVLDDPELTSVGDTIEIKPVVPIIGNNENVSYQWYRKIYYRSPRVADKYRIWEPLEDETSESLKLSAQAIHDVWQVRVQVNIDGYVLRSNIVDLKIQPKFVDKQFEECILGALGDKDAFRYKDVYEIKDLDCSGKGITKTDDFYMLNPSNLNATRTYDFSDNKISDLQPWADVMDGYLGDVFSPEHLKFSRKYSDPDWNVSSRELYFDESAKWILANNQISDIEPLHKLPWDWAVPLRNVTNKHGGGFILDGNRITDISSLKPMANDMARGDNLNPKPLRIKIEHQSTGVSEAPLHMPISLPRILDSAGDPVPLQLDGEIVEGDSVVFDEVPESGVYVLTWDRGWAWGAEFSGAFVIPVVDNARISVDESEPIAGHSLWVTVSGYAPNEKITLAWEDGSVITAKTTNELGLLRHGFVIPQDRYGKQTITAVSGDIKKSISINIQEDKIIDFPDKALRNCVTEGLGIGEDDKIYQSAVDAKFVTQFDCNNRGVADLTGLENIHASRIYLQRNKITSLDTLPTLDLRGSSKHLSLHGNLIQDLGKINPQPSLRTISLAANQISDFSPLVALKNLERIWAKEQIITVPNGIKDIPYTLPTITGISDDDVDIKSPDSDVQILENGQVKWPKAIRFQFTFTADHDAKPKLEAGGSFTVNVVEPGKLEITASPSQLYAGQMINIIGSGFHPGENVTITLHSRVITIGTYKADERGVVEVKEYVVPKTMTPGEHTLSAVGETSKRQTNTKLKILASPGGNDKPVNPPVNPPKPGGDHQPVQPQPSLPGIRPVQPAPGATDRGQQVDRADRANRASENRAQRRGGPTPRSGAGSPAALVFLLAASGCAVGLRRSLRKAN